jgi:hypothetical protein
MEAGALYSPELLQRARELRAAESSSCERHAAEFEPKSFVYTDVKPIEKADPSTLKLAVYSEREIYMELGSSKAFITKVALAAIFKELAEDCLRSWQQPPKDSGYGCFVLMENQLKRAYAKIEELNNEIMQLKEKEQ